MLMKSIKHNNYLCRLESSAYTRGLITGKLNKAEYSHITAPFSSDWGATGLGIMLAQRSQLKKSLRLQDQNTSHKYVQSDLLPAYIQLMSPSMRWP